MLNLPSTQRLQIPNPREMETANARRDEALLLLFEGRWLQVDCIERLAMTSSGLRAFARRHRMRRRALALHGFPTAMRLRCWLREARVAELVTKAATSMEEDGQSDRGSNSFYLSLLEIESDEEATSLISTGLEGEISRDVDRTFPMHKFFASDGGDGQRQLGNVLKAVSLHVPDVGYCQGMNYVVAALLMLFNSTRDQQQEQMAPQEASFWLVVALIRQFGLDDLWRPKMPGLSRCIHLYQQLLRRHFYDLHAHLKKIGMHPSLLATQWFATLFARVLSLDVLARVWDLVLVDGWKMVYRVALAVTEHVRPHIINLDMEACSDYFRKHPRLGLDSLSADALLSKAFSYKITRKMLVQLDEERHLEYLRLRLQKAPLSHEHSILFPMLEDDGSTLKQKESLDFIRSRLQQFDADTAVDMNVLRKKIEIVDRTNAQATSVLTQKSYALSEVTFALAEHTSVQRRLRKKFDKLLARAINEASSPRSSAISKAQARVDSFRLWAIPSAAMEYMQQSLAGCFERAARLPAAVSRQSSSSSLGSPSTLSTVSLEEEEDEEEIEETRRNIAHLELLVPHHATKLHTLFRKVTVAERELRRVTRKYKILQRDTQLAQVELEEAQQFKDSLADQMLQLMLATERQKNVTMQQLFAQVDDAQTAVPPSQPKQEETENGEGI